MSEAKPESTPESPGPAPSLFGELLSLGKLILGFCLIAFGCWRAIVWAFGPDESLFFASRVTAKHAAEEAEALKQYAKGLRELKRGNRTPEERAQDLDKLDRELTKSLEEQPQRDQKGYRMQRWMELLLVLFSFTFGPGLLWAGKDGVRWPKLRRAEPGAAADGGA
jgi:hypothetical protein